PDNNSGTFGYKKYDFFSKDYDLHYKGGYRDVDKLNVAALLYAGYDVGTDRLGILEDYNYGDMHHYTQIALWDLEGKGKDWYGSSLVEDLGARLLYFAIDMNVIKGYYQDEIIDNSFLDTVIGNVELELLGKDNKYFITFKNQNTQNKKGSIFINDSGKFKLAKEDKILLSTDGQYKLSLNKKYEIIPNENQDMIKLDYEYEEIEVSAYKEDGFYSSEYQDMIRLDTINHKKEESIKFENDKYLKLIKKDGYDETPLKGAEFLINELNYTTDENGEILIKLDLDSYKIKEIKAPSGYILKKDKIKIIKKGEYYYLNNKLLEFNDNLAYINIYNYKKPILPNTGYINTNINNLIGLAFIVLSSIIYKRKIP
ncbi:MAG TPA: SpaA isopeptide-forming pilin-related protein, partial [Tissierellaceae bacterium]